MKKKHFSCRCALYWWTLIQHVHVTNQEVSVPRMIFLNQILGHWNVQTLAPDQSKN